MKCLITVVYPVSFEFEIPDNLADLPDEQEVIRAKILDKADELFEPDCSPFIHSIFADGNKDTEFLDILGD